ncbi:MAG: SMC-Scp complex subunit ScpB [Alphaproteobacteria bacterium]|nr:SMC-Scp complex subunit ScpB [Alphaproteobacteria bacterium]
MDAGRNEDLRTLEALLFSAAEPLDLAAITARLPDGADAEGLLAELAAEYDGRGVNLVCTGERWSFRTAPDLAPLLKLERDVQRRLSQAALETLAIVAYHQPVTRAEVETIRGVASSKGSFDALLEAGWIRPSRRREAPGRPLTWVTTQVFLDHFGLGGLGELPGAKELEAAGLLDTRPAIAAQAEREIDEPAAELPSEEEVLPEPLVLSDEADGPVASEDETRNLAAAAAE